MLRALKWAFDIGVRQERVRIAAYLQHEGEVAAHERDRAMEILSRASEVGTVKKSHQEKMQFTIAVNNRVQQIIQGIFDSSQDWIPGASVMYPEDKK